MPAQRCLRSNLRAERRLGTPTPNSFRTLYEFWCRAEIVRRQRSMEGKSREPRLSHIGMDSFHIRLVTDVSWQSLDYYSRVAAKRVLGSGLLPIPNYSARLRCRTLERIERGVLSTNSGA